MKNIAAAAELVKKNQNFKDKNFFRKPDDRVLEIYYLFSELNLVRKETKKHGYSTVFA